MFALFTLPPDVVSSTMAYVGDLIDATWVVVLIAIAIPFGFYIIRQIIGIIPKGRAGRRT